jgi:uncharacterized protein (TIGR02466 family)
MTERIRPTLESSEVVRLFPTFVWKAQLARETYEAINADVLRELDGLTRDQLIAASGEVWQSGHGLHKLPAFFGLMDCVSAAVKDVLGFLKTGYDAFSVTGCWANVAAPGGWHRMHSHPNNFLSGVYYVQVQEGADTINFHDPRPQTGIIRPPVRELTAYNTDQVVVKVQTATLLLFPAWLPHSVSPNESGETRISVSFNVMFSAFAEEMSKPLWGDER